MKEQIKKKLVDLEKQREQLLANLNATSGAIQILTELLETPDAPPPAV